MRSHIDDVMPHVLVLTETHDGFDPGLTHQVSSLAGRDGQHKLEHRWVTIWSVFPMARLETTDKARTVAARLTPSTGSPFIVFGTVLPWTGSSYGGHPSSRGAAFRESLRVQTDDWMRLRSLYPDDEFFVLGDINQDLANKHYCGSRQNREVLRAALTGVGLRALTEGDGDPIWRHSKPCACIDHICARTDSKWRLDLTSRWPDLPVPNRKLSDHFGVAVSLLHI